MLFLMRWARARALPRLVAMVVFKSAWAALLPVSAVVAVVILACRAVLSAVEHRHVLRSCAGGGGGDARFEGVVPFEVGIL